jgi:bacillolysin
MTRLVPSRPSYLLSALLLLLFPVSVPRASAQDGSPAPPIRVHALPAAPALPALAAEGPPSFASDLAERLAAARAAALAPRQPIPQPAPQSEVPAAAPLASRIGRDVRITTRPGVGTPVQIRGERLHPRAQTAAPGADPDLATAREFLGANRAIVGLDDPENELAPESRFSDELGLRHLKFEQRWKGLAVWPAELIVHLDRNGDVYLMDGAYVPTPRLPTTRPVLAAVDARRRALEAAGAGSRPEKSDPELLVFAPGNRRPRLAWSVSVEKSLEESYRVLVDAANGAVLARIPTVMSENVVGSGQGLGGQTLPLDVWNSAGTFTLLDTSKFMFDPTSQPPQIQTTRGGIFILDARNQPPTSTPQDLPDLFYITSNSPSSWSPADSVSAAWGLSETYDYYRARHNRNSLDGNGGTVVGAVRVGQGWHNAQWRSASNIMVFGDADTYAGSIDVVGHELTHGVTSHSADLVYQDQSGAMNESFSDIFGEMVENFVTGSNDWLIGSHLAAGGPLRNMANPAQFGDPARMSQYVNTTSDFGGVHTNSGIFNFAFYEVAAGLPGALGVRDAERIYYRALTVHLTKNSQFLDGRLACIQSAEEIFGTGSPQAQRVTQGFDEAEILSATPAPPPPTTPPVVGGDSLIFLARNGSNLVISRRESAFGDPPEGAFILSRAASEERPVVSGDGRLGFFVTADQDACFFLTDGTGDLACVNLPGTIASVAMSRDTNVYSFVLLDGGQRTNHIAVIDLSVNPPRTQDFTLVSPATEDGTTAGVLFADTLQFTANQRFLVYDAFNVLNLSDGSQTGLWSISAIDFATLQTYTLVPPTPGLDIGNPSIARTSDDFFTFEADRQSDGTAFLFAANVSTGVISSVVVNVRSGPLVPAYTGDDRGIVYSYPDAGAPTGRSLALEALLGDRLTPIGNPQTNYLLDGEEAVVYRRGIYTAPSGNCHSSSTALCLSNNRFQVTATFTTNQGQQGTGRAVPLTSDTGYFTFFQPSNVEVVIKVLNACSFSPRIWVFAGGLTDVATVLTVTDTATGVVKTYGNPQSTAFQPIQDTNAFATCFTGGIAPDGADAVSAESAWRDIARVLASPAAPVRTPSAADEPTGSPASGVPSVSPSETTAGCVADGQSLCLSGGRFRVQTSFRTPQGQSGSGNAVGITSDTGYFWFFQNTNVEMVIKVLNACSFSQRFWVFAGGLTDVEVTTTVTDTATGTVKNYVNKLGDAFKPLQDTNAFATCP